MTETTEKIIQDFTGKDDIEINQFIYDIAKSNFELNTKNRKWYSEEEFKQGKLSILNEIEKWNREYNGTGFGIELNDKIKQLRFEVERS